MYIHILTFYTIRNSGEGLFTYECKYLFNIVYEMGLDVYNTHVHTSAYNQVETSHSCALMHEPNIFVA